jgi:hypothetical protein
MLGYLGFLLHSWLLRFVPIYFFELFCLLFKNPQSDCRDTGDLRYYEHDGLTGLLESLPTLDPPEIAPKSQIIRT